MSDIENRITALEQDAKRHQAALESFMAVRFGDQAMLYAHLELIVELAERLECPAARVMAAFEDWRKHYHQRILESAENDHPALAARMDRRPDGEVGGADQPIRLFP